MGRAKTNYTNMAKRMAEAQAAATKNNGYFEAIELPKILLEAMKDGIEHSTTATGEVIFNGGLSSQYALAIRGQEYVVVDVAGNEYKFYSFKGAAIFAAAAAEHMKYADKLYHRVRVAIEDLKEHKETVEQVKIEAPTLEECYIAMGEYSKIYG